MRKGRRGRKDKQEKERKEVRGGRRKEGGEMEGKGKKERKQRMNVLYTSFYFCSVSTLVSAV